MYNTEIYEKAKHTNKFTEWSFKSAEDMQKDDLMSKLYDRVDEYYRNLIRDGKAFMRAGYLDGEDLEEGLEGEYLHVGIYDSETGEQIL